MKDSGLCSFRWTKSGGFNATHRFMNKIRPHKSPPRSLRNAGHGWRGRLAGAWDRAAHESCFDLPMQQPAHHPNLKAMIRGLWLFLVWLLIGCGTHERSDLMQVPVVNGNWRYESADGDKGENLDLFADGRYARIKWGSDLVHDESGHYQIEASIFQENSWTLFFDPAPESVRDAVWYRNPYGYRIINLGDTTMELMISSRVNPSGSDSTIGETTQSYHKGPLAPAISRTK